MDKSAGYGGSNISDSLYSLIIWSLGYLQAIYLHKTKVLYHVDIKNGVIAKILQLNQYQDNKESQSKL